MMSYYDIVMVRKEKILIPLSKTYDNNTYMLRVLRKNVEN